jgi:cytochrome c
VRQQNRVAGAGVDTRNAAVHFDIGAPASAPDGGATGNRIGEAMIRIVVVALALVGSGASALAQDLAAGEQSFKKCLPCHAVGEGAKNKVGPLLNGLEGRKSGTIEGFTYTEANKNSGLTWDEAVFRDYIKDPRAKIPGTKMIFAGVKNEKEISDLWAYMRQFDAEGKKK